MGGGDFDESLLAVRCRATQIRAVPVTLPPYALPTPVFRFRHLASLAGRAPIGGAREVALACFVAARLVSDCCDPTLALDAEARAARVGRRAPRRALRPPEGMARHRRDTCAGAYSGRALRRSLCDRRREGHG